MPRRRDVVIRTVSGDVSLGVVVVVLVVVVLLRYCPSGLRRWLFSGRRGWYELNFFRSFFIMRSSGWAEKQVGSSWPRLLQ